MIQIQWTSPNMTEAKEIAMALVEKKWIACANIIPEVLSIYHWQGLLQEEREVKVFFKTRDDCFGKVKDFIIKNGSYSVPEVSKMTITETNPKYLKWLDANIEK